MTTSGTCLQVSHLAQIPGHAMYGDWALPGRMIGGRRRMEKLRRMGLQEGLFHVLTYVEVEPWIRDVLVVDQLASSTTR